MSYRPPAVEVFFPVAVEERDDLLAGRFSGAELYGLERLSWDEPGVAEDALWVAARVDDALARRHEDPLSLGYREFTFYRELLNRLTWRVVDLAEIADARALESAAMKRASEMARADALAEGRRLGLIE